MKKVLMLLFFSIFLFSMVSAAWTTGLNDDLIYYYKLDEISGTNAVDEIGNANGSANNARVFTSEIDGIVNTSADFSQGDDFISMGDVSEVDTFTNFSISFWVNFTAFTPRQIPLAKSDAIGPDDVVFLFDMQTNDRMRFGFRTVNDVTQYIVWDTDAYLSTNTFEHLVATVNGTNVSIYVDGVLVNATPRDDVGTLNPNGELFALGQDGSYDVDLHFEGSLDEVGVWNRSLTPSEITNLATGIQYEPTPDCAYEYNGTNTSISCNTTGTFPTITSPTSIVDFGAFGGTLDLNWTDGVSNFSEEITLTNQSNLTFYFTNDTGTFSQFVDWEYTVFQSDIGFISPISELSEDEFSLDIEYTSSDWTSISGILNYDGTNYTTTLGGSGDNRVFTRDLTIPSVASDTNKTLFWILRLTNSTGEFFFNTENYNQTVVNLGIDNCSSNPYALLNLTLLDEQEQTEINGTIEVWISLYGDGGGNINYSANFTTTSAQDICISDNLTNSNLLMDAKIKYSSTNFQTEYYNIQSSTLNSSSLEREINLYDLNSSSATVFDILYKDENLIPVEGVLIDITKEYVSEGLFKTVEIPLTDIDGKATASFEKDTGIYTFYVYKDGELLSTFENVVAVCENEITGDCSINLNALSTTTQIDEFSILDDLDFLVSWDPTSNLITLTFSTLTGLSSDVNLLVTVFDQYQNDTVCDESVTSASGTLTCTVPASYTNQTVIVDVFKDSEKVSSYFISLGQDPTDFFGFTGYFLAIIMIIMIPFMFITSLIGMVIGMIIGVILISLLLLSNGANIYSVTGGIIWFIVAGIILIWKLNNTERR